MKKILLSLSFIFGFAGYAGYKHVSDISIKNSETAQSQTLNTASASKTDSPQIEPNDNEQKDIPQKQPAVRFNEEYEEKESEEDDDIEYSRPAQSSSKKAVIKNYSSIPMRMMGNGQNTMMQNMMMSEAYKNGEYTGNSADAYYGNIQVKVAISGGRITDVQFLDYPRDRQNSIRVNTYAMPILKSEAIKVQSENVDTISGATATSGAFRESLASALAQAKN